MKTTNWTKTELQIYILLTCAHADSEETTEELNLIKSKVDEKTFKKIHEEFLKDSSDDRIEKIDENVHQHEFTNMELAQLRKEMYEIFFSDCNFKIMERNLDRIMDNILY